VLAKRIRELGRTLQLTKEARVVGRHYSVHNQCHHHPHGELSTDHGLEDYKHALLLYQANGPKSMQYINSPSTEMCKGKKKNYHKEPFPLSLFMIREKSSNFW
jgi:hypothetical protein